MKPEYFDSLKELRALAPSLSQRSETLFDVFLPVGYARTTLNTVAKDLYPQLIEAKMHLGMIITLYDDLADHPQYARPSLLQYLYQLNIDHSDKKIFLPMKLTSEEQTIFELANRLFTQLTIILKKFPHYFLLAPILKFDFEQFYLCNRYSELITQSSFASSLVEAKNLGPFNMGIVAAGMMDLMAVETLVQEEIGYCREVFLLGQRIGRISNLLSTYQREKQEGDLTSEIMLAMKLNHQFSNKKYTQVLQQEIQEKIFLIQNYPHPIQNFQRDHYGQGLLFLHDLHLQLEGKI